MIIILFFYEPKELKCKRWLVRMDFLYKTKFFFIIDLIFFWIRRQYINVFKDKFEFKNQRRKPTILATPLFYGKLCYLQSTVNCNSGNSRFVFYFAIIAGYWHKI